MFPWIYPTEAATKAFQKTVCVCVCVCVCMRARACVHSHNCVQLFPTVVLQAPLSVEFSRQEYWSRLPFSPPGDLPDPGIKPLSLVSPALQADSLPLQHLGSLRGRLNLNFDFTKSVVLRELLHFAASHLQNKMICYIYKIMGHEMMIRLK